MEKDIADGGGVGANKSSFSVLIEAMESNGEVNEDTATGVVGNQLRQDKPSTQQSPHAETRHKEEVESRSAVAKMPSPVPKKNAETQLGTQQISIDEDDTGKKQESCGVATQPSLHGGEPSRTSKVGNTPLHKKSAGQPEVETRQGSVTPVTKRGRASVPKGNSGAPGRKNVAGRKPNFETKKMKAAMLRTAKSLSKDPLVQLSMLRAMKQQNILPDQIEKNRVAREAASAKSKKAKRKQGESDKADDDQIGATVREKSPGDQCIASSVSQHVIQEFSTPIAQGQNESHQPLQDGPGHTAIAAQRTQESSDPALPAGQLVSQLEAILRQQKEQQQPALQQPQQSIEDLRAALSSSNQGRLLAGMLVLLQSVVNSPQGAAPAVGCGTNSLNVPQQPPAHAGVPRNPDNGGNKNGDGTNLTTTKGNKEELAEATFVRIPCKARGMPPDHCFKTAHFIVPDDIQHGQPLVCSYPQCRDNGVKFLFCLYCRMPVAKRNFRSRHSHADLEKLSTDQGIPPTISAAAAAPAKISGVPDNKNKFSVNAAGTGAGTESRVFADKAHLQTSLKLGEGTAESRNYVAEKSTERMNHGDGDTKMPAYAAKKRPPIEHDNSDSSTSVPSTIQISVGERRGRAGKSKRKSAFEDEDFEDNRSRDRRERSKKRRKHRSKDLASLERSLQESKKKKKKKERSKREHRHDELKRKAHRSKGKRSAEATAGFASFTRSHHGKHRSGKKQRKRLLDDANLIEDSAEGSKMESVAAAAAAGKTPTNIHPEDGAIGKKCSNKRQMLWAGLLGERPPHQDDENMSKWLMDVLAVSDLKAPIKGEDPPPSPLSREEAAVDKQGLGRRTKRRDRFDSDTDNDSDDDDDTGLEYDDWSNDISSSSDSSEDEEEREQKKRTRKKSKRRQQQHIAASSSSSPRRNEMF